MGQPCWRARSFGGGDVKVEWDTAEGRIHPEPSPEKALSAFFFLFRSSSIYAEVPFSSVSYEGAHLKRG